MVRGKAAVAIFIFAMLFISAWLLNAHLQREQRSYRSIEQRNEQHLQQLDIQQVTQPDPFQPREYIRLRQTR